MRLWVVPIALGLVLLLAAGALVATANDAAQDLPVMRMPREGDMGQYSSTMTTVDEAGTETLEEDWWTEWGMQAVQMPDGSTVELPGQRYVFDTSESGTSASTLGVDLLSGSAALRDRLVQAVESEGGANVTSAWLALSFVELPGPPVVVSAEIASHQQEPFPSEFHWAFTALLEPYCLPETAILGLPDGLAERKVRECLEQAETPDSDEITLDTRWVDHATAGRVWEYKITRLLDRPDGTRGTITELVRVSPELSLLLERTSDVVIDGPEGRSESHGVISLIGWTNGAGEIQQTAGPLPEMPRVALVPWTPEGPSSGDLTTFPFRDARAAIGRTPAGAQYFRDHPGALVTRADFFDRSRYSPGYAGGTDPCSYGSSAAPQPPPVEPAGSPAWSITWSDDTALLWGGAETVRASRSNPLGLALPLDRADAYSEARTGFDASWGLNLAPELEALYAEHALVDRLGAEGDVYLALDPTGFVLFSPSTSTYATSATVGRLVCTFDTVTNLMRYSDTSVVFQDGRATELQRIGLEAFFGSDLPLGLLGAPPSSGDRPGAPSVPPPLLGLAGLLLVGTGVAASPALRIVPGLYTRLSSRDVLEHPLRARLLEAVKARPGSSLSELCVALEAHPSSLKHHLRTLQRLAFVTLTRTPRGLVAHPVGDPAARVARVLALSRAPEVLALIEARPGLGVVELAAGAGMSKERASGLASELEAAGLVRREREGRGVRLFAIPGLGGSQASP